MELPPPVARAVVELKEQGFHVVKNALLESAVQELLGEIKHLEATTRPWMRNPFYGFRTTRLANLLRNAEPNSCWERLVTHPSILPVAKAYLGEDWLRVGMSIPSPGRCVRFVRCALSRDVDGGIAI